MAQELLPPIPPPSGKGSGRGGRRPNQTGRPKGSYRDSKAIVKLLHDGEAVPIEVMMNNMRFYWSRAQALSERLEEAEQLFEHLTPEAMKEFITNPEQGATRIKEMNDQLERLTKLMGKVEKYREKAQAYAVDAAPYCHPRLAALAVKTDTTGDSKKPEMLDVTPDTPPSEALAKWHEFLKKPIEVP